NYVYTAGSGDINTHEFYGGEGKELPSFRAIAVYDMLKKYIYGMLEDGLKLECSDDSLSVEADWINKTEKAGIIGQSGETFTRPDDLEDDLFIMFYDISMKLNNAALDGVSTSFSFDGKNNHNVDSTIGFGSRAPQIRAPAGKREIGIELKTTLTSDTVRSILNAEYGEVGVLEPSACKILQVPLEVNIALCEISGIACQILFPQCTVKAEYDMSGADDIEVTLTLATLGSGTVTLDDGETDVVTDMYVKLTNELEELEAKE
ncbi:MAG: carboxypeptidase regulatory-like domain-containing protein, partial [Methanobrevibacter sp.]|nr:carboxypeptidase regulatory-like domain-containing protein [Methanobrevibacter sp.]